MASQIPASAGRSPRISASSAKPGISSTFGTLRCYRCNSRIPMKDVLAGSLAPSTKPPVSGTVDQSFILLTQSQVPSASTVEMNANLQRLPAENDAVEELRSRRVETLETLIKMAENGHVKQTEPICSHCEALLTEQLSRDQAELEAEKARYAEFLGRLENDLPSKEEVERMEKELAQLEEQDQSLDRQIRDAEERLESILADIDIAKQKERDLDEKQDQFWKEWCDEVAYEEKDVIDAERESFRKAFLAEAELKKLKQANVWIDAFRIVIRPISGSAPSIAAHNQLSGARPNSSRSDRGNVGGGHAMITPGVSTINGCRLGRLPPKDVVDWPEINAAWGHVVLLMTCLAQQMNMPSFQGYKLNAHGSTSTVAKIDVDTGAETVLELYGSGEIMGRLFQNRRFDSGMVAVVDCLSQLCLHAQSLLVMIIHEEEQAVSQGASHVFLDKAKQVKREPPVRIDRDRVGESSIRLQYNQDESWTRALRGVLRICYWLMSIVSLLDQVKERRERPEEEEIHQG